MGVSREFYYGLAIGFLGITLAVLQMMYPIIPHIIGWPIVGLLSIATFICLDIGIRKKEYKKVSVSSGQYRLVPKKRFTTSDILELGNMNERMKYQHGHGDEDGITADRLDGYTWSDISCMPCHSCHKPRNEEGD